MNVLQNPQKFGHGYDSLPALPEVPGIVARACRTYGSSGYGYYCVTELTEVPSTGNTRVNAYPLGGGVRFEQEDLTQLAWIACSHWANVPEAICRSFSNFRELRIIDITTTKRGDKS